ncbi:ABC-2 type transport system permease protein [Paenibacillus sp. yr247]|uniref:ABC transporter permease n=1 Tax=Paenibacillus sp. yr247 TaxID=1761880 RepID=UPI00088331D5|nr:ABC transporter permease [Paenibacillus sp. yr247]SDN42294.1 ABC-2 type transport system permease protein [Paenibacillus sp. yr247]
MNHTWKATLAQSKAELMRTLRNRRFVFFTIIMPVAFFFIFTSTMGSGTKIGGVDWSAYYLMSMTSYGIVGASLMSFAQRISKERSQGWIKLLSITPLPSWSYVFSKVAAQAVINFFIIIMMFVIGGFGKGINLSAAVWIESGLWIWIGGFSFMALGTLLGTMRNTDSVQVLSMILYMGLSVLGGLWMPTFTMSSTMQTIAKFTPTFRLGQGAWNLVGGGSIDWSGFGILAAYVVLFMVLSSYIMKRQEAV